MSWHDTWDENSLLEILFKKWYINICQLGLQREYWRARTRQQYSWQLIKTRFVSLKVQLILDVLSSQFAVSPPEAEPGVTININDPLTVTIATCRGPSWLAAGRAMTGEDADISLCRKKEPGWGLRAEGDTSQDIWPPDSPLITNPDCGRYSTRPD